MEMILYCSYLLRSTDCLIELCTSIEYVDFLRDNDRDISLLIQTMIHVFISVRSRQSTILSLFNITIDRCMPNIDYCHIRVHTQVKYHRLTYNCRFILDKIRLYCSIIMCSNRISSKRRTIDNQSASYYNERVDRH
jgi:hypothetical protein